MKLVYIKGNTGSGKSTIPIQLLEASEDVEYTEWNTVLHDLGWVLIGPYKPGKLTSNGCDSLRTVDTVKAAIECAIQNYPGYPVLFEGMMISTIKTTFYEYILTLATWYDDLEPLVVIMRTTVESCLERIANRGTSKKPPKMSNMSSKHKTIVHAAAWYDQQYVRYLDVDRVLRENMVDEFMKLIGEESIYECADEDPYMTYKDLLKMKAAEVDEYLVEQDIQDLDGGQRRRLLGNLEFEPLESDRADQGSSDPWMYAPWPEESEHIDTSECVYTYTADSNGILSPMERPLPESVRWLINYSTASGNLLELLVQMHPVPREQIPLLTEWEHVSLCKSCKGSRGSCPGYAPRFNTLKPSIKTLWVLTVSMDMVWPLLYGNRGSYFMVTTYADSITESYTRRILFALSLTNVARFQLGVANCPASCRPCAVISGKRCNYPSTRTYSMEATGIDCDWLHRDLYGEWLPWAYKGYTYVPIYMTRYAGIFSDEDISEVVSQVIVKDKTYTIEQADYPMYIYDMAKIVTVPSGVHKGSQYWVYDLEDFSGLDR